ncbi:hypothetical protein C3L33_18378, partial [Rhododendron williamsianum]
MCSYHSYLLLSFLLFENFLILDLQGLWCYHFAMPHVPEAHYNSYQTVYLIYRFMVGLVYCRLHIGCPNPQRLLTQHCLPNRHRLHSASITSAGAAIESFLQNLQVDDDMNHRTARSSCSVCSYGPAQPRRGLHARPLQGGAPHPRLVESDIDSSSSSEDSFFDLEFTLPGQDSCDDSPKNNDVDSASDFLKSPNNCFCKSDPNSKPQSPISRLSKHFFLLFKVYN